MDEARNQLLLRGPAVGEPTFSHENHGQSFYQFPFLIKRLSGQSDTLQVIATHTQLAHLLPLTGQRLSLEGQLRSFNNKSGTGNRLILSVFPRIILPTADDDYNHITLTGVLCKPPILRRTPLGRCICDMMLAVNRHYGRADYLPCIAWGQVAVLTGEMDTGAVLSLEGRVQSRTYTKFVDGETTERTAYEVSIMHLLGKNGTAD